MIFESSLIFIHLAERQRTGIRYRRRQFDKRVKVLKIIKLNYRTGSGLPAPTCSLSLILVSRLVVVNEVPINLVLEDLDKAFQILERYLLRM